MQYFELNYLFNISNKLANISVAHNNPILLKADTGASKHYLRNVDATILNNANTNISSINVYLPNNEVLTSNVSGHLPIKELSAPAQQTYALPTLTKISLLSIGQLCNDNCIAIFTKKKVFIIKLGQLILTGMRNYNDDLWDVICKQSSQLSHKYTTTNKLNALPSHDKTIYEMANFIHACAGSPTIRTFQDAIKNNYLAT